MIRIDRDDPDRFPIRTFELERLIVGDRDLTTEGSESVRPWRRQFGMCSRPGRRRQHVLILQELTIC